MAAMNDFSSQEKETNENKYKKQIKIRIFL